MMCNDQFYTFTLEIDNNYKDATGRVKCGVWIMGDGLICCLKGVFLERDSENVNICDSFVSI